MSPGIAPRYKPYIPAIVVAVILLLLPVGVTPGWAPFRKFTQADILQLLTSLFLIALFLERALEVFLTTWRGPAASQKDLTIAIARRKVAAAQAVAATQAAALAGAHNELEAAERDHTTYKSQTHQFALWAGFILGLFVSAVGVRTLQPLVDLSKLPGGQKAFFNLVDAFVTAGLLAGGSDGIHQITQVFTNFFAATADKAKG